MKAQSGLRQKAIAACCAVFAALFSALVGIVVVFGCFTELWRINVLQKVPEKTWLAALGVLPVALAYVVGRTVYIRVRHNAK